IFRRHDRGLGSGRCWLDNEGQPAMNDIEQAEKTLVALRSKRDALVAHGVALGEERTQLAFGAHTGDDKARKQLDAVNREAALNDAEQRSLGCAIAEAENRL